MNEHGFVFLPSYFSALNRLGDADRLASYDALLRYAFEGAEPKDLLPVIQSLFDLLRPNVDAGIKRYRSKCENGAKTRANAKRKRNEQGANGGKDRASENETEIDRERETETSFVPPTLDEVTQYFAEMGFRSSAEQFHDHYQGRAWKVKGEPIADWRAVARSWERREPELHPEKYTTDEPIEWLSDNPYDDEGGRPDERRTSLSNVR